jgi:uncharacterized protein
VSAYIDASALVPLQIIEAATVAVRNFLSSVRGEMVVSDFAAGEFASVLSRLVRMQQIDVGTADSRLVLFDEWLESGTRQIAVDSADIARAVTLVRRFDLKLLMPDAIHAAVCERHGFALVTLDARLARAAERLGIEVIVPD